MRNARAIILLLLSIAATTLKAQLNTDQLMIIGRNALYFEDYVLSIQYFNRIISARPYLHEPYFFRGLAKFNLDDHVGAEEDLTSSIERNPYVSRSWQLRGLCRANQGKYPQAESDFRMAIKYDPQNTILWQNLAVTAIYREEWDNAAAIIDTMISYAPRNTDAYLMRTQVAMRQKDSLTAHRMIEEALKYDKYSPDVHSMHATLLADEEKYEEAEKEIDRAIELIPNRSNNYLTRALIRYYRNNLSGAMEDYDMVLYIDPGSFYGYYNRGLLRMQVGDDNRAIEDFDKILEIDPDNTMARFNRALMRDNTGDTRGAIEDYSRVLEDYPNFEYGYQCRSVAFRKIGDKKRAEADEAWLLNHQIQSFTNTHKSDTTRQEEDKVRKRSDRNLRNYNKMVIADEQPGRQYATAHRGKVQNKNISVELSPMFAITYYEKPQEIANTDYYYKPIEDINGYTLFPRKIVLTNKERALSEDEVKRHFEEVDTESKNIADYPDVINYRIRRALDFYLIQDFDASLADLNMALTLEGEIWLVYFMRATVRYKQIEANRIIHNDTNEGSIGKEKEGQTDLSLRLVKEDLDMVISQMPDFASAYFNRGNVYAKLNDYKAAIVDYSQAIELNDKLAEAYFNRGLVKIYLGKREEGISDLSKAGELGIYTAYNVIKRFSEKEEDK